MSHEILLLKWGQFSWKYSSLAFHTSLESLLKASWWLLAKTLRRGDSSFHLEWGALLDSEGEEGSTWSGKWCCHLGQGEGLSALVAEAGGVFRVGSSWNGDTHGGILSRTDAGTFPSKRWKGVTNIPWTSGVLALRAEAQVARKVRWSIPSSSMASACRHCMFLACDCWIRWACEEPQDCASLMAMEQQLSASAKALAWWMSASLYKQHGRCWLHLLVPCSGPPLPWWYGHKGPSLFLWLWWLIVGKGHPKIWDFLSPVSMDGRFHCQ